MKKLNFLSNLCSSSRADRVRTLAIDAVSLPSFCRVKHVLVLTLMLFSIGSGNAWGQVSLPYEWTVSAGKGSLPSGVTHSGLGTNYADGNAPYLLKYDDAGDYIQVYTNNVVDHITFRVKKIGGSTNSTFVVEGCTTASGTYSTINTFTISGAQNAVVECTTSASISSTYRYFRIRMSAKGANVGFGYLYIARPCFAVDVTGGSTVILPKGTTTYSTGDWGDNGAPTGAYPTSAVTKQIGEYCCVTFTNAYENNQSGGLQVKASGGVISLDIVSNYGVDVEVVCSGTNGFSIALTGATTKTGQTGTATISTTTKNSTLTITKNTSSVGYIKTIKITPKAGTTYTVSYADGGGSGTNPGSHTGVASGSSITLKANTFTAPTGKQFAGWNDGSTTRAAGASYTVTSNVTMTAVWECITPTISVHPSNGSCVEGGSPTPLTVTASGGTLSYQWKECSTSGGTYTNVTGGSGGTTASYTPPVTTVGTMYYKCEVKNTGSSCNTTATSNYASFVVTPALSSISINTAPTKTVYLEGETFDPTGLVITRIYSNSTSDTYTYAGHTGEFSFSPTTSTALTTSNTEVTITYGGKTIDQSISVYSVTVQALDENGDAIADGGPGVPTFTAATRGISPAADAANYKWWKWEISGAELGSAATTKGNTITNPTGNVTVTAKYRKPRTVTWLVDGEVWTPYTTKGSGTDGTAEVKYGDAWSTLTLPTDPNPLADEGCGDKFMGWVAVEISGELDKDDDADAISDLDIMTSANKASKTGAGHNVNNDITFYAVFADYVGE